MIREYTVNLVPDPKEPVRQLTSYMINWDLREFPKVSINRSVSFIAFPYSLLSVA